MKLSFEQAMAYSRKGYIDEEKEIDRIYLKLIETPVIKLGGLNNDHISEVIRSLLKCYNCYSKEKQQSLTFGEYISFTKSFETEAEREEKELKELNLHCFYIYLNHAEDIIRLGENSTAKYFKHVSLISFLRYVAKKSRQKKPLDESCYNDFKLRAEKTTGLKIDESTTIGEYFNELNKFQNKKWLPHNVAVRFEEKMTESYNQAAHLLIECAENVCPYLFDEFF